MSIFKKEILNLIKINQNSNKLFVYLINLDNSQHNLTQYWKCLNNIEKNKARNFYSFYSNNLSNIYIISHGILRHILSHYTGINIQNIEYIYNEYGKPFLKDNKLNIQFNISHSHKIICYVIALEYKVGIDVEWQNNALNIEEFSNLVLTLTEQKFFVTLQGKEKTNFFFDQWTRKEALIKAYGQGLSYPINTIETMAILAGESVHLLEHGDKFKQKLYCFPLEILPDYSGSIAVEHKIDQIIYLEMTNYSFNKISYKYFS